MEETTETEEEKPQEAEEKSVVDRAESSVKAMKDENIKFEQLVKRQEKLAADKLLGGQSEAGESEKKEPEESDKDYAARVMRNELKK